MLTPMQIPTVHLCGRQINDARHVCAFFSTREEEYAIMAPFVKEGAAQGERILQIVEKDRHADHAARMRASGVDVDALSRAGQLDVLRWEDAYLLDGRFDHERMLAMLEGALADRRARGFPLMRAMGNMEWALKGAPGTEDLLEYETRVNLVSPKHPDVFVCLYDVNKFSAATLFDVMRTHPAVILGGVYHENPFFVPPAQMLREIESRRRALRP